jgi:hypothetical protein
MASAGSLSFLADEQDARILLDRLNADPEIAFIVPDGPRMPPPPSKSGSITICSSNDYWQRWRAVRPVDGLEDGQHILWDISAGPLLASRGVGRESQIPDPSAGWTSERPTCVPNLMPAATIRLQLSTRYAASPTEERKPIRPLISYLISYWMKGDRLPESNFQWSGTSLQPGGSLQTARWAVGLEEWFSQNAVRVHARDQVFWAVPSALQRLKAGLRYDARGFDLDESIRQAR